MAKIARRAGVAKSTVSMALRNDPVISEKQRRRIQRIATRMGYRTNALVARLMHELKLSRKRRYVATLALVNCSNNNPAGISFPSVLADMLDGVKTRANQLGYGVDPFWLYEPDVTPARLADIFRARNMQGVALYSTDDDFKSLLPDYKPVWGQFPVLTIGSRIPTLPFHFVCNDHYSTAMQGCARLLETGYKRIGLYMVRWLDNTLEHRFVSGYRTCLEKAGLEAPPVFYFEHPRYNSHRTYPEAQPAFARWLEDSRVDAVLALNSWIFEWIAALGLRLPDDLGVALLDLPRESRGKVAGMEQRPEWTGMASVDALTGQILRHETGIPPFQQGTLIESTWVPGATVRTTSAINLMPR
jgi:LacI family transcriptional regulator